MASRCASLNQKLLTRFQRSQLPRSTAAKPPTTNNTTPKCNTSTAFARSSYGKALSRLYSGSLDRCKRNRDGRSMYLFRQRSRSEIRNRLLDLLARVHHERTVLHDRFAQRFRSKQQEARAFVARDELDLIALCQYNGVVWLDHRCNVAHEHVAFVHVREHVVLFRDSVREPAARG